MNQNQQGRPPRRQASGARQGQTRRTAPAQQHSGQARSHARAKAPVRRRDQRRSAILRMLLCLMAVAVCILAAIWIVRSGTNTVDEVMPGGSHTTGTQQSTGESGNAPAEQAAAPAAPDPTPTPDPAAERIAQVMARNGENATLNPAEVKDPDTWSANAVEILEGLQADPEYEDLDLTVQDGFPYLLAVNREAGVVTVYASDGDAENPRYTKPYMAMICSGGPDTPTGYFHTPVSYQWRLLAGPCYGQYATRIWDAYLFHSVPYYTQHKDDLEYVEFNKLGTQASLGCIRLMVVDVKWIFDNCPIGTPVVIYDDAANPGPMGKPGTIYIDPDDETYRGWDPTDPDGENPWDDRYLTGTTIRSPEAWEEWDAAQVDSRWNNTINETDLQGYSTDYKTEGTRG
ncbi:L,D-transpeptidase [uncultured Gemmiger sp.]|uniref:L,D-transpeptidase n=1 Tax=uncultured Gemmiger sp. TaxID=1623490 RepID=UPI0025E12624|nr:L,D-transpeptidase [uncultured Gemmiger sp.]